VLLYNKKTVKSIFLTHYEETTALTAYFLFEKLSGFVLMGVIPFFLFSTGNLAGSPQWAGISLTDPKLSLLYTFVIGVLILVINFIRAGKAQNYNIYPQLRIREWRWSTLLLYNTGWIVYLLGYEYLFRGLLFFSAQAVLSLWESIALNAVLYALAHLPKGKFETLGSLPLGVILCLITWHTGSFWACFFIHIILAVSNSMIALRAHPEMSVRKTF
jgi:membrane protease YdiL (CAAX protease family)